MIWKAKSVSTYPLHPLPAEKKIEKLELLGGNGLKTQEGGGAIGPSTLL